MFGVDTSNSAMQMAFPPLSKTHSLPPLQVWNKFANSQIREKSKNGAKMGKYGEMG
jgi:hypothetical protein